MGNTIGSSSSPSKPQTTSGNNTSTRQGVKQQESPNKSVPSTNTQDKTDISQDGKFYATTGEGNVDMGDTYMAINAEAIRPVHISEDGATQVNAFVGTDNFGGYQSDDDGFKAGVESSSGAGVTYEIADQNTGIKTVLNGEGGITSGVTVDRHSSITMTEDSMSFYFSDIANASTAAYLQASGLISTLNGSGIEFTGGVSAGFGEYSQRTMGLSMSPEDIKAELGLNYGIGYGSVKITIDLDDLPMVQNQIGNIFGIDNFSEITGNLSNALATGTDFLAGAGNGMCDTIGNVAGNLASFFSNRG
ncbi:MAG: hypothetical protein ABRQ38_17845 [Candidatus Eremiobacterota bacterium]